MNIHLWKVRSEMLLGWALCLGLVCQLFLVRTFQHVYEPLYGIVAHNNSIITTSHKTLNYPWLVKACPPVRYITWQPVTHVVMTHHVGMLTTCTVCQCVYTWHNLTHWWHMQLSVYPPHCTQQSYYLCVRVHYRAAHFSVSSEKYLPQATDMLLSAWIDTCPQPGTAAQS